MVDVVWRLELGKQKPLSNALDGLYLLCKEHVIHSQGGINATHEESLVVERCNRFRLDLRDTALGTEDRVDPAMRKRPPRTTNTR